MAASNFPQCFALVLRNEGGYVDNTADPGGATNLGCTKATWEAWVGHPVTNNASPSSFAMKVVTSIILPTQAGRLILAAPRQLGKLGLGIL